MNNKDENARKVVLNNFIMEVPLLCLFDIRLT